MRELDDFTMTSIADPSCPSPTLREIVIDVTILLNDANTVVPLSGVRDACCAVSELSVISTMLDPGLSSESSHDAELHQ